MKITDNSNDDKSKHKNDNHYKTKQNHDNDYSKNKHNVNIEGDGNSVSVENHTSLLGKRGDKNKVSGKENSLEASIKEAASGFSGVSSDTREYENGSLSPSSFGSLGALLKEKGGILS